MFGTGLQKKYQKFQQIKVQLYLGRAIWRSMSLATSWAGAVTAWVVSESVVVYNAPIVGRSYYAPLKLLDDCVFEITAFNPAISNIILSREENFSKLESLKYIVQAHQPPLVIYPSFGFDNSGYREDGIAVACSEEFRDKTREFLLEVAKDFGQGAIYEFKKLPSGDVARYVVPAFPEFENTRSETIVGSIEVIAGWPKNIWHPIDFYSEL